MSSRLRFQVFVHFRMSKSKQPQTSAWQDRGNGRLSCSPAPGPFLVRRWLQRPPLGASSFPASHRLDKSLKPAGIMRGCNGIIMCNVLCFCRVHVKRGLLLPVVSSKLRSTTSFPTVFRPGPHQGHKRLPTLLFTRVDSSLPV